MSFLQFCRRANWHVLPGDGRGWGVTGRERNLSRALGKQRAGPLVIHVIVNNIQQEHEAHPARHGPTCTLATRPLRATKFCWGGKN